MIKLILGSLITPLFTLYIQSILFARKKKIYEPKFVINSRKMINVKIKCHVKVILYFIHPEG